MEFFEYDILKAESDGPAYWLEAAPDLKTAATRIEVMSAIEPGLYLVFSQRKQRVVLTVEPFGVNCTSSRAA